MVVSTSLGSNTYVGATNAKGVRSKSRIQRSSKTKRQERGRPRVYDPLVDEKRIKGWEVARYRSGITKRAFEEEQGLKKGEIRRAQDRKKAAAQKG